MRIVFAGTPAFAAHHLQALLDAGLKPVVVYTQPDRPAGRGQKLRASAVKQLANSHQIPVEQPVNFKAAADRERLAAYAPDVLLVIAYGLLLPQAVLDIPRIAPVNVHASLLPRWRGAAPIQRAIEAGDRETGVCLMRMDIGLDTGPVYRRVVTPILPKETTGELQSRLAALGAQTLLDWLTGVQIDMRDPPAEAQSSDGVTYAKKISTDEAQVSPSLSCRACHDRVRAFNPAPGARVIWRGEALKIWRVEFVPDAPFVPPGDLLPDPPSRPTRLLLGCADGAVSVVELQRPGGNRLSVSNFLTGFQSS